MQTNKPNDKPNSKISFKPLHDGVGFHPFSEGLPYAPQTKNETKSRPTATPITTDYSRGTGAVSAGTPSFSMPPLTTRQIQQQNTTHIAQKAIINTRIATPPVNTPIKITVPTPSLGRKRFFAYLLDTVFHFGFWISVNIVASLGLHIDLDASVVENNWVGFALFLLFSQWFFIAMQEVLFENSIGKFFFGLEFKRNNSSFFASSLLLRSIVFMIGICFGFLGLYFLPQDKIAEIQLKHT